MTKLATIEQQQAQYYGGPALGALGSRQSKQLSQSLTGQYIPTVNTNQQPNNRGTSATHSQPGLQPIRQTAGYVAGGA